jgi:hypothetical protein
MRTQHPSKQFSRRRTMENAATRFLSRTALIVFGLILAVTLQGGTPASRGAHGLTINLVFESGVGDSVDPCALGLPGCGHDADLTAHMEAAANIWSRIFRDHHTVTIRYRWVESNFPTAEIISFNAQGKPTDTRLRIPANFNWFYDPTPELDEEFDMRVRLFRTTHPAEKAEAFLGTAPEVFEVGFNGRELSSLNVDLLTTILHEMGHALGLASTISEDGPNPSCSQASPYFFIDSTLVGGFILFLKAYEDTGGSFDCGHLALGGITACKTDPEQSPLSNEPSTFPPLTVAECTAHQALLWTSSYPNSRAKPSIADIVAVAKAAGWQDINFPRKYALQSNLWHTPSTWLGNKIPEALDDVYVVNEASTVTVTSNEAAALANLFVTSGNTVEAFFDEFIVSGRISLVGEGTTFAADISSDVQANQIDIGPDSMFHLWIDAFVIAETINNSGVIRGNDSVIRVNTFVNDGVIRANGGELMFVPGLSPSWDLDGTVPVTYIEALTGDLSFHWTFTDSIRSDIRVGAGRTLTFALGWEQEPSFNPIHRLVFEGVGAEARINGTTSLAALVIVNGIGRINGITTLQPSVRLELDVGGPVAGQDHDQLIINGTIHFGGTLDVSLDEGFTPAANDRFPLVLYGARTGEFATANLPALGGGLVFFLDYGASQLDLVVGFDGATPGDPNCEGQATSTQAALHGGIAQAAKSHGYSSVAAFLAAISDFCN